MRIEAVDLFCGVGGLSYGLKAAGIKVKAGYDIDANCEFPYEANVQAKFHKKNVELVNGKVISKHYSKAKGTVRLLAGCAPCQPFSTLALGRDSSEDAKWSLLEHFARLIEETQPELVSMENVPRVTNHAPFDNFIATLRRNNYYFDWKRVRCADYGIPQERRRFVLVASKLGEIKIPSPTTKKPITVAEAIGHLPKLGAGETCTSDPLHKARSLTPINLKRIQASKPGGTWLDWPEELLSECHKADSGKSFKSVYARMKWSLPSPTITTQCYNFGTGRFGHPEQDRAITLREAAILQSFPDDYKFVSPDVPVTFAAVGRMIGNAVPPALGKLVGDIFKAHLKQLEKKS
ncbi:DNA cytosine methyltransferase [Massilia sp. Root335]|uniref:DNA cytosine methyltransferase n=1 Tax=Massilia sp. Root335 TaxID=1736517 RepID=UPI0009EC214F|nr:DNA cytosine methyltransferase [Massilia sp. Root335]